jgi:hypothetical protein
MEGQMTARSLKSVTTTEERQAGAEIGAGLFICRNADAKRIADIQTDGFAPRY